MKTIRMKTLYCTPARIVQPDVAADFDDAEAKILVDGGFAVYADEDPSTGGKRRPAAAPAAESPASDPSTAKKPETKETPPGEPPVTDPPTVKLSRAERAALAKAAKGTPPPVEPVAEAEPVEAEADEAEQDDDEPDDGK